MVQPSNCQPAAGVAVRVSSVPQGMTSAPLFTYQPPRTVPSGAVSGGAKELVDGRTRVGFSHPPVEKKSFGSEICAKGLKPGELYDVGVSMRRIGSGEVYIAARFRSHGRYVGQKFSIGMKQPRADGVWRDGEVVMRVPEGADEICFDISAKLNEGTDTFEFDRFTIYKIGDPLPVWPPETLREK